MRGPTNAIVSVTSDCNSKCVTCDIWQHDHQDGLPPESYEKLPSSLTDINVTGGEPFLRKDLPEIIQVLKKQCPDARLIISSNGLLTDRIAKQSKELLAIDPKIAFRVSIDGLEAKHDEVRGIPGGFQKSIETVKAIQKNGATDVGIGLTVCNLNVAEIQNVYNLSLQLGVEFSLTTVTSSPFFFGNKESLLPEATDELQEEFNNVITGEMKSWDAKRWARAYYDLTLLEFISSRKRFYPCDAGSNFFYLSAEGNVYPCEVLDMPFGNIGEKDFNEIWNSKAAVEARTSVKDCNACWMVCTAKTPIKKNLHKAAFWVLQKKLKVLAGARVL